jgi:DNA-binding NarL/FixJ family response regulator
MPDQITVLLADDHSLVRRGFRRLLEDDPSIAVDMARLGITTITTDRPLEIREALTAADYQLR